MAPKKNFNFTSYSSLAATSSKFVAPKEVPLSTTPIDQGTLPYFEGFNWHSSLSEEDFTKSKISYNISKSISLKFLHMRLVLWGLCIEGGNHRVFSSKWPSTFVHSSSVWCTRFCQNCTCTTTNSCMVDIDVLLCCLLVFGANGSHRILSRSHRSWFLAIHHMRKLSGNIYNFLSRPN